MSRKIFISARLDDNWLKKLNDCGEVDHYDWGKANRLLSAEELKARLPGNEILVIESDTLTNDMIDAVPELKLIVVCRGGVVNVDVAYATQKGILVTNTPGRNADAVADLTVCFMIMISRHVQAASELFRSGQWPKVGKREAYLKFQGIELYGRTAGLVGVGAIGRRVAARLKAFNMKIIAFDPYYPAEKAQAEGINLVELDELASQADFVSLHAPVTPETRCLFGARQIGLMRPDAYFINTARAEVADEAALLKALQNKHIAGAAVDVYLEEPLPTESPWYGLSNVICTPHIGGASQDVIKHQSEMAVQAVLDYCAGKTPEYVVKPKASESD